MLQLRHRQFEELRAVPLEGFEDQMVAHLREHFPDDCRAMDDAALRVWIRYGIERAEAHGLSSQRDVCKYLNLMMTFGRDFDVQEPTARWARPILGDPEISDPSARIERLCEEAMRALEEEEK